MLENVLFSLERVTPFLLLILFGYFLGRKDGVSQEFFQAANRFVFRVALPLNLFCNVAAPNSRGIDLPFMGFIFLMTLLSFLVIWGLTELLYRDKSIVGTLVQGSFRGNLALIGVPLSVAVAGEQAAQKAAFGVVVAVPLYNILSVMILSARGKMKERPTFGGVIRGVLSNRLFLGVSLAIPFALLDITLPKVLYGTMNTVGAIATPLGLISIGGLFRLADATARLRPALYATCLKMVALPTAALLVSLMLGFRGEELVVLFLLFASPTSIGSFSMASSMGGDGPLASNILILTTFLSSFTFAVGIFTMRTLGLF